MKKFLLVVFSAFICLGASANFGNFLNKVSSVVNTVNSTDEQKQATAELSDKLTELYKSFLESCTYSDISKSIEKAKSLDVSGCPESIQNKYKTMIGKLESFDVSIKTYLDKANISSEQSIKTIVSQLMSGDKSASVSEKTADVVDKSNSFFKSLNELMTAVSALKLLQ